jgi:hypothetical protein
MKTAYSYAIIKENYPELGIESALLENNYKPKKYAFIEKVCHKDGSENIARIIYLNDLQLLQEKASGYISWYNYPINICKNIQGYLSNINNG